MTNSFRLNFSWKVQPRKLSFPRKIIPMENPPPKENITVFFKTSVYITITKLCANNGRICKQCDNYNLRPIPESLGDHVIPQRHCCWIFQLYWTKWLSQNFYLMTLGVKGRVRGTSTSFFFGQTVRGNEL